MVSRMCSYALRMFFVCSSYICVCYPHVFRMFVLPSSYVFRMLAVSYVLMFFVGSYYVLRTFAYVVHILFAFVRMFPYAIHMCSVPSAGSFHMLFVLCSHVLRMFSA